MFNPGMNTSSTNPNTVSGPQGSPAPQSMALSVTRHAQIAGPSEWQFLVAGIDSLDVGCFVEWDEGFSELLMVLEARKAEAAGTKGALCQEADCLVLPSGKPPNYAFHLAFPEFHLYIGRSSRPHHRTPNVYASINSLTLWGRGLYESLELVEEKIEILGGNLESTKISRVDLAADFLLPEGLSSNFLKSHLVSRSRRIHTVEDRDQLETFYVGAKNSPIQVRIYNKGLEVQRGGTKNWFLNVWGLKNSDGVWRVEFQIRRPALKINRINSPDELLFKAGSLWEYLTKEWVSFRCQDDATTTRRTVEPFWAAVQNESKSFGLQGVPLNRDLSSVPADVKTCLSQIAGRVLTFAARTNCETLLETVELLNAKLFEMLGPDEFADRLQTKRIGLGRPSNRQIYLPEENENDS